MHNKNWLSINKYWQKCPQLLLSIAVASSTVIVSTKVAQALSFNFTYEPGTSLEHMLGFEMAGQIWSSYLGLAEQLLESSLHKSLCHFS